jgi:hypothetical protein
MSFNKQVEKLISNKKIIEELVTGISQEQAGWKPAPDRWSVLEALNHIIDIEIEDFRHNFNMILFNPEEKWPSFEELGWITSRKYNERDFSESINKFITEREKSVAWLKGLEKPDLNAIHSGNGFNGKRMRAGDVLISWIAHDLFHIRQLALLNWDILNKWGGPFSSKYSGFFV